MKPVCETIVHSILPAVRAMVAKDLIDKYGFTQKEAAEKMGLTQPAISQYYKNSRGYNTKILENNKKLSDKIHEISEGLAKNQFDILKASSMFCELCDIITEDKIPLTN